MANFKIREPRPKNIDSIVQTYNYKRGQGIEIFYDIKKGKLFLAEYYESFNDSRTRKISVVSEDVRLQIITPEYLDQEIKKIKQGETASRIAEKKRRQ